MEEGNNPANPLFGLGSAAIVADGALLLSLSSTGKGEITGASTTLITASPTFPTSAATGVTTEETLVSLTGGEGVVKGAAVTGTLVVTSGSCGKAIVTGLFGGGGGTASTDLF